MPKTKYTKERGKIKYRRKVSKGSGGAPVVRLLGNIAGAVIEIVQSEDGKKGSWEVVE